MWRPTIGGPNHRTGECHSGMEACLMAVRGLCFATASYQWQCNSGPSRTREQDLISRVLMGRSTMRSGSGIPRTAHCSHCFASRSLRPDLQHNEDTSFTGQSAQAKSATHDGTKCSDPRIIGLALPLHSCETHTRRRATTRSQNATPAGCGTEHATRAVPLFSKLLPLSDGAWQERDRVE